MAREKASKFKLLRYLKGGRQAISQASSASPSLLADDDVFRDGRRPPHQHVTSPLTNKRVFKLKGPSHAVPHRKSLEGPDSHKPASRDGAHKRCAGDSALGTNDVAQRDLHRPKEDPDMMQSILLAAAVFFFVLACRKTLWWALSWLLCPSLSTVSFAAGVACLLGALWPPFRDNCKRLRTLFLSESELGRNALKLLRGDLLEAIQSIDRGVGLILRELKAVHCDTTGIRIKLSWLPSPTELPKAKTSEE